MMLSDILRSCLSKDCIKNQSLVEPFVVSLKQSSIAFTSGPPVDNNTAILALFVAVLSVSVNDGCWGNGTMLLELHTDFSLLS